MMAVLKDKKDAFKLVSNHNFNEINYVRMLKSFENQ